MRTFQDSTVPLTPPPLGARRRGISRRASALAVALAAVATQAAEVPAARADTQTVQKSYTTPSSVSVTKTASVDCPVGKKVVGTAFDVVNGGRQVRVTYVLPTATRVSVGAAVDPDGYAGSWALRATAVCTSKPLNGYELKSAFSAQDLSNPKAATATCSDGKELLGTGAALWGGAGAVVLEKILPSSTTDSVTVRAAHGQVPPAGTWSVGAVAICADLPFNHWVSTVSATSANSSATSRSTTAQCPSGSVLFGMGGTFNRGPIIAAFPGPPPPYRPVEVVIDQFSPNGSSTYFPTAVTMWANEDQDGTSDSWDITAYALCYGGDFVAG